jgi:DNA-binding NarL/FixJ family response regulator
MNAGSTPPPLNVFIVEDAPQVRLRIAEALSSLAQVCVVGEAEDTVTALMGIAASRPDVALVDLRLADGSGIELLARLSREQPAVVTMVLTNHSGPPFQAACDAAGADFFFDKTSEFDAACRAIQSLVSRRARPPARQAGDDHVR